MRAFFTLSLTLLAIQLVVAPPVTKNKKGNEEGDKEKTAENDEEAGDLVKKNFFYIYVLFIYLFFLLFNCDICTC